MNKLLNLTKELESLSNKKKAIVLQGFFKTGPGEYGEGDVFLGIVVPVQRQVAKKYLDLRYSDLKQLLNSKTHEYRLVAVLILVTNYKTSDGKIQKQIFNFYLKNLKYINNWDLVDLSAPNIIGNYLLNQSRDILYKLVRSKNIWQRRIAIVSTYSFIRNNEFTDTFKIAKILLTDNHDLIHKAVGWMLREAGKRDQKSLEKFLQQHSGQMPRTMLRYAIERFQEDKRKSYLKK
ncbi:DNA alkylation repair protein [Candidatus Falkowbacteria bacterium]|uniref:DNA alkylation repair protein n=1 Tax=Candidatus Buchananbacteria bacterium CG10_big_fil_rev_8_21_14_0_10_33_19 TaxID=1974525 RepID=A0A2H0W4S8_9BACT|nr:DNA alkylation repair protein [Candidatus Falkowbacteria bacterium]PIS06352.1 MAG: DNA alkylation repair protein [Candidatus Buchananbacteria bacterium CG10_big_fil_rev_8_21_14_0_10_33_19]